MVIYNNFRAKNVTHRWFAAPRAHTKVNGVIESTFNIKTQTWNDKINIPERRLRDFLQRLFHFTSLLADNLHCNRMIFLSACSAWLRREHENWFRTFGEELGPKMLAHGGVYEMTAF